MKATRVFQLTALALLVVSVVQVGWWLLDQRAYTVEKVRLARAAYAEQTAAAQALLDSGANTTRVQQLLPGIVVSGGHAVLAPELERALTTEERHRYNQYAWEGSFFLLALAACIAVIARALRAEARISSRRRSPACSCRSRRWRCVPRRRRPRAPSPNECSPTWRAWS
jgi:hypothetical protein